MTLPRRAGIPWVLFLEGVLAVIFFAAAGLLVLAGVVKLRRPERTARALSSLRLGHAHLLARLLGATEIVVGAGAAISPAALAPAVALLYGAFALFVAQALARGVPLESCGCLGESDTEPSAAHVAVTAVAALAGGAATVRSPVELDAIVSANPLEGTLLVVALGTAVYLTYLTLAFLPSAFSAYQRHAREADG